MPATRPSPPEDLQELVALQDRVVSRAQLRAYGVDRFAVRNQVTARRWQLAGRRVVVWHTGQLTTRQQEWVAVLSQGATAALAGLTAARRHGLHWAGGEEIHVLVGRDATPVHLPGVRVHQSRRFDVADIHPGSVLPTVRIDRALVDAAAWTRLARSACGVLARGVQQRLTTAGRLLDELTSTGAVRHRALLLAVLGDIEGGAQSFAEIDLGRLARQAGLPPPKRQAVRLDTEGRRRYLDADFGGFAVEVDGAVHLLPLGYWNDMARQNDLVIVTGKPILRFSTVALRSDPSTVVAQLAAAGRRWLRLAG